jgi:hypothetical protein
LVITLQKKTSARSSFQVSLDILRLPAALFFQALLSTLLCTAQSITILSANRDMAH